MSSHDSEESDCIAFTMTASSSGVNRGHLPQKDMKVPDFSEPSLAFQSGSFWQEISLLIESFCSRVGNSNRRSFYERFHYFFCWGTFRAKDKAQTDFDQR
jgi:hypothetical protein